MARLAPLSMPVRGGGGNDGNARRAAAQDGQDQAVHPPTKEGVSERKSKNKNKWVWPMRLPCGQQKQQMARFAPLYLTLRFRKK